MNKIITWNRGGQTGDHTWKVSRQQTKSSRIAYPTGHYVELWFHGTAGLQSLVPGWDGPFLVLNTWKWLLHFFTSFSVTVSASWFGIANASFHYVKLSLTTKMCLLLDSVFGIGSMMSSAILSNRWPGQLLTNAARAVDMGYSLLAHFSLCWHPSFDITEIGRASCRERV